MRRIAAAGLAALAVCAVVAGCGSASSANATVTVKGSFGKAPAVTIPAEPNTSPRMS